MPTTESVTRDLTDVRLKTMLVVQYRHLQERSIDEIILIDWL